MMSGDDQSRQLAAKLGKNVDEFVAQLKQKKYEDGWPEDKWEEEMEKHPIFMTKSPDVGELPPLLEALQQLKYDPNENTPEELAVAYKDDGNAYFRSKKYQCAISAYTEGLKAECKDDELNAQLYANRAAALFCIGNFKAALKDVTTAKILKPNYFKAIFRGAHCCFNLKLLEECIVWCDEGLKIQQEDLQLIELKKKAINEKKIAERNKRKAAIKEQNMKKEKETLKSVIKERGVNFKNLEEFDWFQLGYVHPAMSGSKVYLDEKNCLVWPVLLLYPEYGVTDFIQHFHENSCFADHLQVMFGSQDDGPSWDAERKYHFESIQVYFQHYSDGKLVIVNKNHPLQAVLSDKRFQIQDGMPSFFLTVQDSEFDRCFRERNGIAL